MNEELKAEKTSTIDDEILHDSLSVIALGGLNELGKNMWLFQANTPAKGKEEVKSEYIVVDAGVQYPGSESPGVDYTLADYKHILGKKIEALVLTNVHEYHSGGAHHLINKCDIKKVVGSKLAIETCKLKLGKDADKIEWVEFSSREQVQIGNFCIIPFTITSSSKESYAIIVEAKGRKVFYTGTYKIDQTPTDGIKTDVVGITTYASACYEAEKPIDLMISCSVGVEKEGYSQSELELKANLKKLISSKKTRVIINTYNSNTIRLQNLFDIAEELKRKVALLNKDARETCEAAENAGCLEYDKKNLISIKDIDNHKDGEVLIISTAPEGDALAELEKIGFDKSLEIQIKEGDVVINSADLPPGTVRTMAQISDQFFLKKAEIIGGRNAKVNIESHALTEEMKFLFNLVRPKYFLPGFGETRHLVRHAKLAVDTGFDPGAIFILDNGDFLDLYGGNATVRNPIETGEILFSNAQDIHVDTKIIKERENLAKEGVVIVSFSINKKKRKVVSGPVFSAKACTFSNNKEWRAFCLMNSQDIIDAIELLGEENNNAGIEDYQTVVRDHMNRIIRAQIGKRPAVIAQANLV